MCMTWGEIKAKVEDAGVSDDHEIEDFCIGDDDNCLRVIHEDGKVCVEGVCHDEVTGGEAVDYDPDESNDAVPEPETEAAQDKVEEPAAPTEGEGEGK